MNIPLNVDWHQILLHLFNFVILFGILYFLLYKPTKDFMQKRADYYKKMDSDANENLEKAKQARQQYEAKLGEAEKEASELKTAAAIKADRAAKKRIEDAKDKGNRIIEDAKKAAEAQKDKILLEANSEIENMVSAAIDKAMASTGVNTGNSFDEFLDAVKKE